MLSVTAALVARGMTDREIYDITKDYCDGGWGDPDLGPLIATAREKYRQPDSELTVLRLAPLLQKLADAVGQDETIFNGSLGKQPNTPGGEPPPRPPNNGRWKDKVNWLLDSYGYCMVMDRVIELYQTKLDECALTPAAFDRRHMAWHEIVTGPRGGVKVSLATQAWELAANRVHVQGVRMHPGESFPLFTEGGELWKNSYRRPRHKGKGNIEPFTTFMQRFLPTKVEREWFFGCMAYKWRHPEVPGTCVMFIADEEEDALREGKYGVGRGFLFKIAHKLYGMEYARTQSFSILDGSSGQSAYNDWLHGSVLVTVDESQTSATAHRRGERKSVYEVLKNYVDPAPTRHRFNPKGRPAFDGWSYCSIWMASNHADALAIPAKDRRFTILNNGKTMVETEIKEIVAWMEDEGNIAALAEFLEARDLSTFNMYQPLDTTAKRTMIEMSVTQVEEVLRELMEDKERGLVFTYQQLEHVVEDLVNPVSMLEQGRRRGNRLWQGEFRAAWSVYCVGLKTKTGTHWKVRIDDRQVKLYCFRTRRSEAAKLPEAARRAQAAKWGPIDKLEHQLRGLKGGLGTPKKDDKDQ
jgi:hypothetical protein